MKTKNRKSLRRITKKNPRSKGGMGFMGMFKKKVPEPESEKESEQKLCCRIGKFKKGTSIYCDKHSKTQKEWLIPENRFSQKTLKKVNNRLVIYFCLVSLLKIIRHGKLNIGFS